MWFRIFYFLLKRKILRYELFRYDGAGPSRPKRRIQNKKALTNEEIVNLLAELSDEYPSDYSYNSDSDEEFFPPTLCPWYFGFGWWWWRRNRARGCMSARWFSMVENIIWEDDSISMKTIPFHEIWVFAPTCWVWTCAEYTGRKKKAGKILRKQCKSWYYRGKRKDTLYVCKFCEGFS